MLRFLLAFLLVAHGVAHLVGFAVPWRLIEDQSITFGTSILGGRVDLGETGMRTLSVGWLLLAAACVVAGLAVAFDATWAPRFALWVLGLSAAFCLLFLPEAKWGVLVNIGAAVLLAFWTVGRAADRWDVETAALHEGLAAASAEAPASALDVPGMDAPPPVSRYLAHALPADRAPVLSVELEQDAEFFLAMGDGAWQPLTATQRFTTRPPGFVWDARIRMAPFVDAFIRDAYVDGQASMVGRAMGVATLVDQRGTPELDAGALMRYLAEAVWFPTALRPSERLTWAAVDDRTARATLADGETSVTLEFRFNARDEVEEIFAPDRFREVDGRYEPTPWRVTCRDHARLDGQILIPTWCEVAWILPEGPQPYWRGSVTRVTYD